MAVEVEYRQYELWPAEEPALELAEEELDDTLGPALGSSTKKGKNWKKKDISGHELRSSLWSFNDIVSSQ